ncbi:MAG: hypothetical protein EWV60_17475 [Microcystis sp. Msp_OC_L_20101000_S702]|nr:MAG: hypothetical protein EWV60_17475 [Microcystis sp. Msp_OC_L_20101000_S702]
MLKVVRHPPYQGGQGGSPRLSAPPLSRGAGGIGTPLIKGGRGDRHLPYQGGIKGGLKAKSIFNLIITSYLYLTY